MANIKRGNLNIPEAFDMNGDGTIDTTELSTYYADKRQGGNNDGRPDRVEIIEGLKAASEDPRNFVDYNGNGTADESDREQWRQEHGVSANDTAYARQEYNPNQGQVGGGEGADWSGVGDAFLNMAQVAGGILTANPMLVANGAMGFGNSIAHRNDRYDAETAASGSGGGYGAGGVGPTAEELTASYDRMDPNARLLDQSYASQVHADPRDIAAQRQALAGLQRMGEGKYSAEEINGQRLLQQQAAQWEKGQRDAIFQGMGERGMGGSGFEALNLLGAQQGSANRSAQATLELQRQAAARALQAQQAAMQGSGQMREQGFSESAYNADALDDLNRFNLTYQRGIDAINNGLSNAEEDSRTRAEQTVYENGLAARGMTLQEWEARQAQRNRDQERSDSMWDSGISSAVGLGTDLYNSFRGSGSTGTKASAPKTGNTTVYGNTNAYGKTPAPEDDGTADEGWKRAFGNGGGWW